MKILMMDQGSTSWHQARLGVITASEADALISPTFKIRKGDGVDSYLYKKIAEKVLNWSPEMLDAFPLEQGKIIETVAIPWYAFTYNCKPQRVGFCITDNGLCGCSPDAVLEDGTGLEIKAPQGPNMIRYLLEGVVPEQYRVQLQYSLWVTKAPRWKFVAYSMTLPALVVNVEPDPVAQEAITQAVEAFVVRFKESMNRINQMRDAS